MITPFACVLRGPARIETRLPAFSPNLDFCFPPEPLHGVTATADRRYAIGSEIPTSPDASHDWLSLRPLESLLAGWLDALSAGSTGRRTNSTLIRPCRKGTATCPWKSRLGRPFYRPDKTPPGHRRVPGRFPFALRSRDRL